LITVLAKLPTPTLIEYPFTGAEGKVIVCPEDVTIIYCPGSADILDAVSIISQPKELKNSASTICETYCPPLLERFNKLLEFELLFTDRVNVLGEPDVNTPLPISQSVLVEIR
jgi:hypothetical protein